MDTEVTERPVDDAPPAPAPDLGDQGMVISWQAGKRSTNRAPKPSGEREAKRSAQREAKPSRRQRRAERRAAKRYLEPLFPEFAETPLDSVELGEPPQTNASPAAQPEPEPPPVEAAAKPKPRGAKRRVAPPVEDAVPEPGVLEPETPLVEDPVPETLVLEPEAPPVEEPAPKPRVAKPKLSMPPPPKARPSVSVPASPAVLAEPAWEHPGLGDERGDKRFRLSRVLAGVFVGSVLAAAVMVALVVAPDLFRARGEGPNVPTLTVRSERPVPTSRHFTVTVSNVSGHPVVAACTASVTNPAGTREVAKARFALGPIAADATASYEGQLRWVAGRSKMAPGIAVGCNEQPA